MSMYRYRPEYINRRLNANYGIAKISFPSYRNLLFWLMGYILISVAIAFSYSKYILKINIIEDISLDDKVEFIKFIFTSLPFLTMIFIIVFIIFNKEVLFSFWNSTKDRIITEEDTMQIYNEMTKTIIPGKILISVHNNLIFR